MIRRRGVSDRKTRLQRAERVILCATDLADAGDEVLRQASEAARERKARLVALHVLPDPLLRHPLLPLARKPRYAGLPAVHARVSDQMRGQLTRALGSAASAVEVQIEHGTPHAVIIERAETLRADLIVVGGATSKIGHEAERVVRYAHGPVLVARSSPHAGGVLAATDFSDAALPAVAAAVDWARRHGAPLALLHVVDLRPLMMQPDFGMIAAVPLTPEIQESMLSSAKARLDRAARRYRATATCLVEVGDAAAMILDAATRISARLIVVGTAGATGLKRMILGSVAETVVRRANCSTLVVRLRATPEKGRR